MALKAGLAAAAALSVAACASTGATGPLTAEDGLRLAARAAVEREPILTQMSFWAAEHARAPEDLAAAQNFADALRRGGRYERACAVALEGLRRHRDDPRLLRTLGLAQLAAGRPREALRPLALAISLDPADWRSRSSLGVALDQLGQHEQARQAYQEALALQPDDPGVLTNLGVSWILTGEPEQAEVHLRRAAEGPGATPEARQNLSLALGLQGKLEEAEQIARVDLPAQVAAANSAYVRGLFQDPRSWNDLRQTLGPDRGSRRGAP